MYLYHTRHRHPFFPPIHVYVRSRSSSCAEVAHVRKQWTLAVVGPNEKEEEIYPPAAPRSHLLYYCLLVLTSAALVWHAPDVSTLLRPARRYNLPSSYLSHAFVIMLFEREGNKRTKRAHRDSRV